MVRPSAALLAVALLFAVASPAAAGWPLVWDFASRSDETTAALLGPEGDLWVVSESWVQGAGASRAVLLRIDPEGGVVWATEDPDLTAPTALALRPDGGALVLGGAGSTLRVSSFSAGGALEWSRTRSGVAPDTAFSGLHAAPVWDPVATAWRVPAGIAGAYAILSWEADGDPLPDILWSPPAGSGRATSLLLRAGGGFVVAGVVEDQSPPIWWTVALDAAGSEIWSRSEGEETTAGVFSGAFLFSSDPVRVWAVDETGCGLFSLLLWSLDSSTGAPQWTTTWPPPGDCSTFEPYEARLAGDRIVVAGHGNVPALPAHFDAIALSFDATNGDFRWARPFAGATNAIEVDLATFGGSALVASTLFPPQNPGPTPLWLASWDSEGTACGAPLELPLPARVNVALPVPANVGNGGTDALLLVGSGFVVGGSTQSDVIVQRLLDPCAILFADGFESGDTSGWSATEPVLPAAGVRGAIGAN